MQTAIDGGFLPSLNTPTLMTGTMAGEVTDVIVECNSPAPATYTAPDSIAWAAQNGKYGLPLSIFDTSGAASTNNITIAFTGGQSAGTQSTLTINTDFGGVQLLPKTGGGWVEL